MNNENQDTPRDELPRSSAPGTDGGSMWFDAPGATAGSGREKQPDRGKRSSDLPLPGADADGGTGVVSAVRPDTSSKPKVVAKHVPPAPGDRLDIASLRPIVVWPIWPAPQTKLPKYLVRERGARCVELCRRVLSNLPRQVGVNTGLASGAEYIPGTLLTLRVTRSVQNGHMVATDVTFHVQNDDLYISVAQRAFSLLAILRNGVVAVILGLVLFVIGWFFTTNTGLYGAWVQDYARKYSFVFTSIGQDDRPPDASLVIKDYVLYGDLSRALMQYPTELGYYERDLTYTEMARKLRQSVKGGPYSMERNDSLGQLMGLAVNVQKLQFRADELARQFPPVRDAVEEARHVVQTDKTRFGGSLRLNALDFDTSGFVYADALSEETADPWTSWQLFSQDPRLFFTSVGVLPLFLAIAGAVGFFLASRHWLHTVAGLCGQPTPDFLRSSIESNTGVVLRALTEAQTSLGITKEDILEL